MEKDAGLIIFALENCRFQCGGRQSTFREAAPIESKEIQFFPLCHRPL